MRRSIRLILSICVAFGVINAAIGSEPAVREWTIDGVARQTMIAVPDNASTIAAPLVFGFHGHGGSMKNAARTFRIHELWPEAIVVYMQGLNTPGQLTDPEGKKSGWQKEKGDQKDRDLHFFDEVLKSIEAEFKVDKERVFSMGHSNGGGFTYLLWSERPQVFAAMAPSGSAALKVRDRLTPKPMLHIAGENDPLVKYAWQTMMIDSVKTMNQCGDGKAWESKCTLFPSKIHTPVVTFVTAEGHKFPQQAPALIVKFFQEHSKL